MVACFPAGASAIRSGRVFSLRRAADLAAIVNQAIGGAPVRPVLSCRMPFRACEPGCEARRTPLCAQRRNAKLKGF